MGAKSRLFGVRPCTLPRNRRCVCPVNLHPAARIASPHVCTASAAAAAAAAAASAAATPVSARSAVEEPQEPLPEDWTEEVDAASGQRYYFNNVTGDSSWIRPNDGVGSGVAIGAWTAMKVCICPRCQTGTAGLRVCLSVCLPVCLSVCLPVCLSACLSVCLSVCLSACLLVCLPVCLGSGIDHRMS